MTEWREPHHEYHWALPSVLLGDGVDGRPVRRSTRDWVVDVLMFLAACGITLLTAPEIQDEPWALVVAEQVAGALSCAAVWLRRRWPVGLALVTAVVSTYLELVGGASVVGLFTVAVHRPFKVSGPIVLLCLVTLAPYVLLRPDPELGTATQVALGTAIVLTVFAWGVVVRARRQLVWSLRQRAVNAADEAKRLERERIAREMHDVLAHRISMLSLHAGALEFRPDAPADEIARAASAIRNSAHQALQDLREVIGVLRHSSSSEDDPVPDRPQPTLADLCSLVEECRQAGMRVSFTTPEPAGPGEPAQPGKPGGPADLTRAGKPAAPADLARSGKQHAGPADLTRSGMPAGPADLARPGKPGDLARPETLGEAGGFADLAAFDVPQGLGRNVYRIVQEALTNARKHAGGAPVTVTVSGRPGEGVTAEVRNPLWARYGPRIPGAGAGLIGLTERVQLAGGALEYGPTPEGDFRLRAWLPWTP